MPLDEGVSTNEGEKEGQPPLKKALVYRYWLV